MPKMIASPSEAEWRAQDDLRTLMEAKKIEKDRKRMDAVRKLAKEKMAEMKTL